MELKCAHQNYEWGKNGQSSAVANLLKSADQEMAINDDKPYAELWMGTHPNGPSVLKTSGQKLSCWIEANSQALGSKVVKTFGVQLPFLFKVLSVRKALSIQAHPSKAHAEDLHRKHPDLYKDPNHKPELAIALTNFEALCGFRPINEIVNYVKTIPELRQVIGQEAATQLLKCEGQDMDGALKTCFTALMTCEASKIEEQLSQLLQKLEKLDESSKFAVNADLLKRLHSQFPGDVGCFSIYLLNYVVLKPGEAIFLGPNEPHAYLYGDCVECMACSDNVVRAGLTPKYKDVGTLCSMLNYRGAPAEEKLFKPSQEDKYTVVYRPPVPDFAVAKISVPAQTSDYHLIQRDSASILIVTEGQATTNFMALKKGSILFLPEQQELFFKKCEASGISVFQAFCNI